MLNFIHRPLALYALVAAFLLVGAQDFGAPLQIVRPSEDHSYLETVPEGIEYLRALKEPIAVISTLGAIHSGKSYLINQLIQKQSFPVGYTVRPETCGIWIARYPYDHLGTKVLFLDTEGLFSPDAQGAYDVKLFAIATLMSSEVIYNTVKFIDSQQVDALETLIRRTNFFGLRAYARKQETTSTEVSNLSIFLRALVPSQLSWVVQDFVQDLDGQTPEEWLRSLLDRSATNNNELSKNPIPTYSARGGSSTNPTEVSNYFTKVDCVTLPLPTADTSVLMKLDRVPMEKLDPSYLKAVTGFRQRLLDRAYRSPKSKGINTKSNERGMDSESSGRIHMTGADLADLLEFLVSASNTNGTEDRETPFPELPSIADQFTELQLKLMKTDILTILERDLMSAIKNAIAGGRPMSKHKFDEEVKKAIRHARELWEQVMRGIINNQSSNKGSRGAESEFDAALVLLQDTVRARNCQMVADWCLNYMDKRKAEFSDGISKLYPGGPYIPEEFAIKLEQLKNNVLSKFTKALTNDASGLPPDCCNATKSKLEEELSRLSEEAVRKNTESMTQLLDSIGQTLLTLWHKHVGQINLDEIRHAELREALYGLKRQLLDDFNAKVQKYGDLTGVILKKTELSARLEGFENSTFTTWEARCVAAGEAFLKEQERRFKLDVRWALNYPTDSESLRKVSEEQADRLRKEFTDKVVCADVDSGGRKLRQSLEQLIAITAKEAEDENDRVYLQIVQGPLIVARNKLMEQIEGFYNPAALKRAAMEVATVEVRKALMESPPPVNARDPIKPYSVDDETIARCAAKFVAENLTEGVARVWSTLTATLMVAIGAISLPLIGWSYFATGHQSKGTLFFVLGGLVAAGGWHLRSSFSHPLYYLARMHPAFLIIPVCSEIIAFRRLAVNINSNLEADVYSVSMSARPSVRGGGYRDNSPHSQMRYSEASARTSGYQSQTPHQTHYGRMSAPCYPGNDHSLFKVLNRG